MLLSSKRPISSSSSLHNLNHLCLFTKLLLAKDLGPPATCSLHLGEAKLCVNARSAAGEKWQPSTSMCVLILTSLLCVEAEIFPQRGDNMCPASAAQAHFTAKRRHLSAQELQNTIPTGEMLETSLDCQQTRNLEPAGKHLSGGFTRLASSAVRIRLRGSCKYELGPLRPKNEIS